MTVAVALPAVAALLCLALGRVVPARILCAAGASAAMIATVLVLVAGGDVLLAVVLLVCALCAAGLAVRLRNVEEPRAAAVCGLLFGQTAAVALAISAPAAGLAAISLGVATLLGWLACRAAGGTVRLPLLLGGTVLLVGPLAVPTAQAELVALVALAVLLVLAADPLGAESLTPDVAALVGGWVAAGGAQVAALVLAVRSDAMRAAAQSGVWRAVLVGVAVLILVRATLALVRAHSQRAVVGGLWSAQLALVVASAALMIGSTEVLLAHAALTTVVLALAVSLIEESGDGFAEAGAGGHVLGGVIFLTAALAAIGAPIGAGFGARIALLSTPEARAWWQPLLLALGVLQLPAVLAACAGFWRASAAGAPPVRVDRQSAVALLACAALVLTGVWTEVLGGSPQPPGVRIVSLIGGLLPLTLVLLIGGRSARGPYQDIDAPPHGVPATEALVASLRFAPRVRPPDLTSLRARLAPLVLPTGRRYYLAFVLMAVTITVLLFL